jgi:hypothetical protein
MICMHVVCSSSLWMGKEEGGALTKPQRASQKQSSREQESDPLTHPQWFRATNNPFFIGATREIETKSMHPDDVLATIPLVEDAHLDLMTLTDLHLDDFVSEVASVPVAIGSNDTSAVLKTSLGQDFLSLFAQH